jgi:hypothetical protein
MVTSAIMFLSGAIFGLALGVLMTTDNPLRDKPVRKDKGVKRAPYKPRAKK